MITLTALPSDCRTEVRLSLLKLCRHCSDFHHNGSGVLP